MSRKYTIQDGDTPLTVAKTYGASIASLIKANQLSCSIGGDIFSLVFTYIGPSIEKLKSGDIMRATYRANAQGHPVYESDGRYYVFPAGIPENTPVEVGSPFQDGQKIFISGNDWYTVHPWLEGQSLTIP